MRRRCRGEELVPGTRAVSASVVHGTRNEQPGKTVANQAQVVMSSCRTVPYGSFPPGQPHVAYLATELLPFKDA